ncbi:MAG: lipopolysaccharide kinase InaA family protein [Desulfuromonas sp.]|nr:lipopolysaccharide kinase InaA family protein [Desulfuromonas sp.]
MLRSRRSFWRFCGDTQEDKAFARPETCIGLTGEQITSDRISNVRRVTLNSNNYYIKQYCVGGKHVRRFLGRSRAQGEWQNLEYFAELQIPVTPLVAYGRHKVGKTHLELLVTAAVEDSSDLATLAQQKPERFANRSWTLSVMRQVAEYTRRLHADNFVHWDLKWRNILVQGDADPKIYFFDCPLGRRWYGGLQRRGAIKDLGCLDSVARLVLTRTQRLRFLLLYRQEEKLTPGAKCQIRQIDGFLRARAQRRAKKQAKKVKSTQLTSGQPDARVGHDSESPRC